MGRTGQFADEIGKVVYKVTVALMLPFPVICGKLLTLLNQKGVGDGLKIEIATPFFVFMPTFFPSYIDL